MNRSKILISSVFGIEVVENFDYLLIFSKQPILTCSILKHMHPKVVIWLLGQESRVEGLGSRVKSQESGVKSQGSGVKGRGSGGTYLNFGTVSF